MASSEASLRLRFTPLWCGMVLYVFKYLCDAVYAIIRHFIDLLALQGNNVRFFLFFKYSFTFYCL